jgi:4-amino-4-deoxy-L-arabinose transferase-like glycosyltransferase
MYKNRHLEIILLVFSFLFILFHHLWGYGGHFGWDDMEYANLSHQWATGTFHLSDNHFSYRLPIIVLSGISYKLFGVNDFSSALPAMLITMFILSLVYWVVRKRDSRIVVTAILITLLMPSFLFYSDKIMADIYVAAGIFVAFATLHFYRFEYRRFTLFFSLLFSCSLLFAFITKEVVVLVFPVLLVLFISDLLKKRFLKFWLLAILSGIFVLAAYHLIILHKTGSLFSRYTAIEINSYLNPCSYEYLPFYHTLQRIGYEFWVEILIGSMLVALVFLIPSFSKIKRFGFSKAETFWVSISALMLLSANFMTKSYNAYSPMCIDIRHYLFLVPVLAVAAAPNVIRFFYSEKKSWFVPVFATLLFAVAMLEVDLLSVKATLVFYACLVIILWTTKLFNTKKIRFSDSMWILFLAIWFIVPFTQMAFDRNNGFKYIKPYVENHFKTAHESTIVLTDPVMKRIADYYMNWDSSHVRFINERSYNIPYLHEAKRYWVYQNGLTWWLSKFTKPDPMLTWYLTKPYILPVNSFYDNILYRIAQPEKMWRPTLKIVYYNDMEWNYLPHFSMDNSKKDSICVHSGKYAYVLHPQGFSPTFILPLVHLLTDYSTKFEVKLSAFVYAPSNQMTSLVVSIEDTLGKTIIWLGKPLKEIIKPKKQWQKVDMTASYETKPETNKFKLKVYLWNNDTSTVWVDDMKITITGIEHL